VKHIVYVIEIPVTSNPLKFELLTADDEGGNRRPLVWADRADAEAYADNLCRRAGREMGDADFALDYEVVPLTGETENVNEPDLVLVPRYDASRCPHC
jgi:hypothetical protein